MPNLTLEIKEIVRLYVEEEMTVREIATRFGRSYGQVYGVLRARVVMRPRNGRGAEYVSVANVMRERIVAGDWPAGRKILSQEDLAAIFDVRIQTIREAIAELRQGGYLRTVAHKGTYVRSQEDWTSAAAPDDGEDEMTGAADRVGELVAACEKAGLEVTVLEEAGRVRVSSPHAHPRMAETITLRPDGNGVPTWYWSWDEPICPGRDIELATRALLRVVAVAE